MTSSVSGMPTEGPSVSEEIKVVQEESAELASVLTAQAKEDSAEDLQSLQNQNTAFNKLMEKTPAKPDRVKLHEVDKPKESVLVRKEEADSFADNFSKRDGNKQYRLDKQQLSRLLQRLGSDLTEKTEINEIILAIRNSMAIGTLMPDSAQVDKVFDFLLEFLAVKAGDASVSKEESAKFAALAGQIRTAKETHLAENKKDIEVAQKIIDIADLLVENQMGTAPEMIKHVRDIVNNPQDYHTKFKSYEAKGYTYKEMKKEFDLIFKYVGPRLKEQDILPGELTRIWQEVQVLQAILQTFLNFKRGMPLAHSLYEIHGQKLPPLVTFESLTKTFIKMVEVSYPGADKMDQIVSPIAAPAA